MEERPRGVIHPVAEPPCHKLQQGAKAGIENSCLVNLTNLVSSSGRNSLGKVELVGHWWSIV